MNSFYLVHTFLYQVILFLLHKNLTRALYFDDTWFFCAECFRVIVKCTYVYERIAFAFVACTLLTSTLAPMYMQVHSQTVFEIKFFREFKIILINYAVIMLLLCGVLPSFWAQRHRTLKPTTRYQPIDYDTSRVCEC